MARIVASGVRVYCRHDSIEETGTLRPNALNPNQHPATQIKKLVAVIQANGWRMPITVSTRSGLITKGHGRLMAAKEAGWTHAPVEYQAYKNEAAEWADVVADNQLSELGETDEKLVAEALKQLRKTELPAFAATGYDESEWKALMERLKGNPQANKDRTKNPLPPPQVEGRFTVILHYNNEEHAEFETLAARAQKDFQLLTTSDTMLRLIQEAK